MTVHSPLAAVGWPLPAEPQPEPIMTLPRTAAQVLSGHVRLEVRCIDRMLLTFRQPRLQYGQGIHGFFCHHRGNQFVSSALMLPMTERFAADIRHYIDARGLDLVRFAKGQSKDQIARRYLACHDGGEQILFAGVAQEKTRVWRTRQRRDPVTGKRYPWLCQEQAMVNHWYFYGFDAGFGPFYVKFCGYFPYTGQIYLNGHEYAKRQCARAGIGFTALDNAFGATDDPAAVQRICDGLTDQKIYRFAGKWLARLPHPFTRADEDADYCWQLSVQQAEFSTTMALDRPASGPDLLRAADPRQHRHRPPGQGQHRLRPQDPPARQEPYSRDLPDPGDHRRGLPLPLPVLQEDPGQTVPEGRTSAQNGNHAQPAARLRHRQRAD